MRTNLLSITINVLSNEGKVAGYTWTTQSSDKGSFYPQEDRPMAFGRLRAAKK